MCSLCVAELNRLIEQISRSPQPVDEARDARRHIYAGYEMSKSQWEDCTSVLLSGKLERVWFVKEA